MWVGECRRISGAELQRWGLAEHVDTVLLLLSELVTNAIQHGSGHQIDVRLSRTSSHVRIEVRGGTTDLLTVHVPSLLDEHGRGLLLVDMIANAWGVDPSSWVWCTIDTAQGEKN